MDFFAEFWTQNENVLNSIHNGILADDKEMIDCILYNNEMLENFKYKIAMNVIERKYMKNSKQIFYDFKPNKSDSFLNDLVKIDFDNEFLIVIISAEIQAIIYSDIIDCFFIHLKDKSVEKQNYSAGICKRKKFSENNFQIKFCFLNEKPHNLKVNRPINNNDEY